MTMTFTEQQLKAFARYVRVQRSNRFNMLSPQAAAAANISQEEQVFIIENYAALEAAFKERQT